MISDFTNPNINLPNSEASSVSRQNQQAVSPSQQIAQKTLSANAEALKFPNNEQIFDAVDTALEQQQAGKNFQRGSIVNILA